MSKVPGLANFSAYQARRVAQLNASRKPEVSFKVQTAKPNRDEVTDDLFGLPDFIKQSKGLCEQMLGSQALINSHAPNGELKNLLLKLGCSWKASSVELVRKFIDDNPNAQLYHPEHIHEGSQLENQNDELVFLRDVNSINGFVITTLFTSEGRKTVMMRPNEDSKVEVKNTMVSTASPSGKKLRTTSGQQSQDSKVEVKNTMVSTTLPSGRQLKTNSAIARFREALTNMFNKLI